MSEAVLQPEASTPQSANKINLDSIRLSQNFGAQAGVKKAIAHVRVGKPHNSQFFRVHPGPDYRLDVMTIKTENGDLYLLNGSLIGTFPELERPSSLRLYVTRHGNCGLWPVQLPAIDGNTNSWVQSAFESVPLAEKQWIRLVSRRDLGLYETRAAQGIAADPEWPDVDFHTLVDKAFSPVGRYVHDETHPLIAELEGRV